MRMMQGAGYLQTACDSGSVIHGSVVDFVAINRLSDAEVIEMGAIDQIFVLRLRVSSGEHADDIRRFNNFVASTDFGLQK